MRCSPRPDGLAQAFVIGADFIGDDSVALVLGDNIFYGRGLGTSLRGQHRADAAATSSPTRCPSPRRTASWSSTTTARSSRSRRSRERPRSSYAVPGLYFYDNDVVEIARYLKPERPRRAGDHRRQRRLPPRGDLSVSVLPRGTAWFDTGTFQGLLEASQFVHVIEARQGHKIGCVEEVAWRNGWLERRPARGPGRRAGQERLRRLPAPAAGRGKGRLMQIRPLKIEGAWEVTPRQFPRPARGVPRGLPRRPPGRARRARAAGRADQHLGLLAGHRPRRSTSPTSRPRRPSTSPPSPGRSSTSSSTSASARRPSASGTACCWTRWTAARSTFRGARPRDLRRSRTTRRSSTCAPSVYAPTREHGIHPLDPELGLVFPDGLEPLLSPKDAAAPTLSQAREQGLLPRYDDCLALTKELASRG